MKNCVFTGFNEDYWKCWGSAWVYSLREIAGYKGEAIVVDCGLSTNTIKKIESKNISTIKGEVSNGAKIKSLLAIAQYAKTNKGNFVFWDADVFFESSIDEVFKQIKNKIIISKNKNLGFIGAPNYHWVFFEDLVNFIRLTKKSRSIDDLLTEEFNGFIEYVSDTWNFTDLHQIDEKKLKVDGKPPAVIHPAGSLKVSLVNKGFLFYERGNRGYLEFIKDNTKISRKLINKK